MPALTIHLKDLISAGSQVLQSSTGLDRGPGGILNRQLEFAAGILTERRPRTDQAGNKPECANDASKCRHRRRAASAKHRDLLVHSFRQAFVQSFLRSLKKKAEQGLPRKEY